MHTDILTLPVYHAYPMTDGITACDGPQIVSNVLFSGLLSVPECDLFHGEKRSVTKGCESMLVLFCVDLVHRVICV